MKDIEGMKEYKTSHGKGRAFLGGGEKRVKEGEYSRSTFYTSTNIEH
jgi:hypothetical protein